MDENFRQLQCYVLEGVFANCSTAFLALYFPFLSPFPPFDIFTTLFPFYLSKENENEKYDLFSRGNHWTQLQAHTSFNGSLANYSKQKQSSQNSLFLSPRLARDILTHLWLYELSFSFWAMILEEERIHITVSRGKCIESFHNLWPLGRSQRDFGSSCYSFLWVLSIRHRSLHHPPPIIYCVLTSAIGELISKISVYKYYPSSLWNMSPHWKFICRSEVSPSQHHSRPQGDSQTVIWKYLIWKILG